MVFSWFNTSKVDAFVDAEVADLVKRVPPARLEGEGAGAKKAADQLAKGHDLLLRRAKDFVQREKPNLFQKARIANRMSSANCSTTRSTTRRPRASPCPCGRRPRICTS